MCIRLFYTNKCFQTGPTAIKSKFFEESLWPLYLLYYAFVTCWGKLLTTHSCTCMCTHAHILQQNNYVNDLILKKSPPDFKFKCCVPNVENLYNFYVTPLPHCYATNPYLTPYLPIPDIATYKLSHFLSLHFFMEWLS